MTVTLARTERGNRPPAWIEECGCRISGRAEGRRFAYVMDNPDAGALERLLGSAGREFARAALDDGAGGAGDAGVTHEIGEAWTATILKAFERWEREILRTAPPDSLTGFQMRAELTVAEIAVAGGRSLDRTVRNRRASLEGFVGTTLRIDGRTVTAETSRWAPVLSSTCGSAVIQAWEGGARDSVERALALHGAVPPPAMEAAALFSPSAAGVLLHEICGHLLEADLVMNGITPFTAAPGERIAAEALTIMDDPLRGDGRVSLEVDDEGEAARVNLLVDSGALAGYLSDAHTSGATAGRSTGNARRDSYRHPCLPRMTNLSVAPGTDDPADLLSGISRGLYVERLGRGQVDPRRGEFRLEVEAGRLIESGSLGRPAAGAFIVGSCRDLLLGIDGVGGDVAVDPGAGVCIKEDQIVPVGQIAPSLRLARVRILPGVVP